MAIEAECVGGPLDGESTEIVKHDFYVPVDGTGKVYTTADALNPSDRMAHYQFEPEQGKYVYVGTESNR
ncbi:MAG: hypothetical protein ACM359_17210 [Bacillota bacterium]